MIIRSNILRLDTTKHLLQHTLEEPSDPVTHADIRHRVPMVDVRKDLARFVHQPPDLLVRLPLEHELLLRLCDD